MKNEQFKEQQKEFVKIYIEELISFYDEKRPKEAKKPASSITGIIGEDLIAGLFKHYIEQEDKKNGEAKILSLNPKNGKWLDRWIIKSNEHGKICYQTEIKNWSAHSFNGKSFHDLSEIQVKEQATEIFNDLFQFGDLKDPSVGKVLHEMKGKTISDYFDCIEHRPLVCFWMPICKPNCQLVPFFEVEIIENSKYNEGNFKTLAFFSASIYLRTLLKEKKYIEVENKKTILIEAPNISERLKRLNALVNLE
jgi:hypothetical protein